jgi:hypothetical protein
LISLFDDSKEGLRAATGQTIRNLYVGRPKVMNFFRSKLDKMVECLATFTTPKHLYNHIMNLVDYTIDENGTPLPANVKTLIDLGVRE